MHDVFLFSRTDTNYTQTTLFCKAVGATVAVQVLNLKVGSFNPMLSTSDQAQIPRLASLTDFKVVHMFFQPRMQVDYSPGFVSAAHHLLGLFV